jgi:hypothetical protein
MGAPPDRHRRAPKALPVRHGALKTLCSRLNEKKTSLACRRGWNIKQVQQVNLLGAVRRPARA